VNNALEKMWKEAIASSGVGAFVGPDKNHEACNLGLSVSGQISKEKPPEYKSGARLTQLTRKESDLFFEWESYTSLLQ
jgi:hypothetical protein